MSYLSPVDSAQVYFEQLDADDLERPRCDEDRDGVNDRRERFDRLEDSGDRYIDRDDRYRDRDDRFGDHDDRYGDRDDRTRFERFERSENERLADPQGQRPLPRL